MAAAELQGVGVGDWLEIGCSEAATCERDGGVPVRSSEKLSMTFRRHLDRPTSFFVSATGIAFLSGFSLLSTIFAPKIVSHLLMTSEQRHRRANLYALIEGVRSPCRAVCCTPASLRIRAGTVDVVPSHLARRMS